MGAMVEGNDEILKLFYDESREHFEGIEEDLLSLEKNGANIDLGLVNSIFRAVHTIKGSAGFFGLDKLGGLSHAMENILDRVRKKELVPTMEIVNTLLHGADLIKIMINTPENENLEDYDKVLAGLRKILDASLDAKEQESAHENIDIRFPDGKVIFSVNKYDFDRARKSGKGGPHNYLIEYDLVADIEKKGKNPVDLIGELELVSEIIDSRMDIAEIKELHEAGESAPRMPFYVLISSIIEKDLVYDFLDVEKDKIHYISDPSPEAGAAKKTVEPRAASAAGEKKMEETKPETKTAEPQAAVQEKNVESPKKTSEAGGASSGNIRVNVGLLDKLMSLAGELVLARNQLMQGANSNDLEAVKATTQKVDFITAELQEAIMATRMQSIGIVFNKFNRIVRDLARDMNKDVRLIIEGEHVELDKSIIEAIGDPLTHLVRNALDHGIESPEAREAKGKSRQGTLKISALHEAGHVMIKIADDGKGIDVERIKAKAVATGLATHTQLEDKPDKDIIKYIFRPGFSTAEKVTDISGRGVGMDVVYTNLAKLGGTIDIDTSVGKGSTMAIKLPLTLAIIPSLLLSVGDNRFAIPQVDLLELVRISVKDADRRLEKIGNAMVMRLRGALLPIVRLSDVLAGKKEMDSDFQSIGEGGVLNIAVVNADNLQYGLIVDNLLDSSEIVVKPLGQHLKGVKTYAGATILGDGQVALILDLVGIKETMGLEVDLAEKAKKDFDELGGSKSSDFLDTHNYLIVNNGPKEQFGIPLGLVARIEKIKSSSVERRGGLRSIKYRDGILPLIAIEDVANVSPREESDNVIVVVFKVGGREIGLMLSEILDIVETNARIDDITYKQTGILGSTVINDRITLIIELYELVDKIMPDCLGLVKRKINTPSGKSAAKPLALVADDSKFFLKHISELMRDMGFDVMTAVNGQNALEIAMENERPFDIVLTDIEMPLMNGFEFAEKLREVPRFSGTPVFAITSVAGLAAEQRAKRAGINEYLLKFNKDEIYETCMKYLKNAELNP